MKTWMLLAALAPAGAFAQVPADPLAAPREKLLETIAVHRKALIPDSPRPSQAAVRFGPRLEQIKGAALVARTRAQLVKAELDFVDWSKVVLDHLYGDHAAEARAEGREPMAEEAFRAEKAQEAAVIAGIRQLSAQRGLDRDANNIAALSLQRQPAAVGTLYDGGRAPASEAAPVDDGAVRGDSYAFDDPRRYAKVREALIRQGASPRVIDAAIAEGIRQKVDPMLVLSVIWKESHFKARAHNKGSDARGLMQLLPSTAEDMGVRGDLFDVRNNLRAGVRYLKWIANDYFKMGADLTDMSRLGEGKLKTILASYNAGIGNVRKWIRRMGENLPSIPFAETRDYVAKITDKLSAWLGW